jgi:opacity protein-like surface antigen
MRFAALVVFVMCISTPAVAAEHAGEPNDAARTPIRVAVRAGAALPLGNAYMESGALATTVAAMVPLRLDVGYRLSPRWTIGAQASYGLLVPNACDADCSGSDVRVGAMITYDLAPSSSFDPWLGLGLGYEWLSWRRTLGGRSASLDAAGPEAFELSAGFDWHPGARLRIGPVLSASLGRFDSIAIDGAETRDFAALVHSWAAISLRGAYDL